MARNRACLSGTHLRVHMSSHRVKYTRGVFTNDVLENKFRRHICACIRRLRARNLHSCVYKRGFGEQIPTTYLRVYKTSQSSKHILGAFTNEVLESKFIRHICACIRRLRARNPHTGAFTNDVLESKLRRHICAHIRRLSARNSHLVRVQTTF